MIDMLAKILIFGLLAAAAVANPVGSVEDDDDLPVYTEKVVPGKPTQVPKFGSKKVSSAPRREAHNLPLENRRLHDPPAHTTLIPRATLKATKPVRGSSRPLKRTNRIAIAPSAGYNEITPISGEYDAPSPSFAASKGLGVEYATDVEAPSSHEDSDDDYRPRRAHKVRAAPLRAQHEVRAAPLRAQHEENAAPLRAQHEEIAAPPKLQHQTSAAPARIQYRPSSEPRRAQHQASIDIGSAVGNAPQIRYAVAPESFAPAPPPVKDVPDYTYAGSSYDEPQPYIFGYELKDENGSTQSRKEQGDDYGNKRGSYGYMDGYGIYRQVDYIADAHGFRAVVKTNEPGTDNQNPADVEMHSDAQVY